jgi:antirestriction protein ArdC
MKQKFDIYADVTARILDLMEKHGTDWTKPWADGNGSGFPISMSSDKAYTGINVLLLWAEQRSSIEWGTYKAWQSKGAQVRKGERGTQIVYFQMLEKTDEETGQIKKIPMLKYYTVFNAEQVDGYKAESVESLPNGADKVAIADHFIARTKAHIDHNQTSAFYVPSRDMIGLPKREAFKSTDGYYSTVLHELTHWTGAKHRLDRLRDGGFGSTEYAKEELVAEIGSAFLCVKLGVTKEPREDHAKYLNNWMKALRDDKRAIVRACKLAQSAVEFLEAEVA